jgi:glycosyltransferase involved in cell wall biosynthesis
MKPRVAVVVPSAARGEIGGAERFFAGLRDALIDSGAAAEIVAVPSDESDFAAIERSYLRFYDLDLGGFDGVISSKSPSYLVRHPNHVCYLLHTMRVFYDMFEVEYPHASAAMVRQRGLIHAFDSAALAPPHTRRLFAIGEEVALRLRKFNGLDAEVMRCPSTLAGLHGGSFGHLLLPGRLHRWKRVDLAIEAMRHVRAPVALLIPGIGEDANRFQRLARRDARIRFLGRVSDEALAALYADALAVLFVPRHEDLGLITLEAFACGKPVITCSDSGEPARLVADGENGFVCAPDAREIGARISLLAAEPDRARVLGERGRLVAARIAWRPIAGRLMAALGFSPQPECAAGAAPAAV